MRRKVYDSHREITGEGEPLVLIHFGGMTVLTVHEVQMYKFELS